MKRMKPVVKELLPAAILLALPLTLAANVLGAEIDDIRTATKAANASWTPAETSIYKLSAQERKKRNGYVQPPNVTAMAPGQTAPGQPVYLLSAPSGGFDWRNYGGSNYVTAVRDQGSCGSCWAFATTAGLESYVLIHGTYSSSLNLSEQVVISCSNAGSCNGGSPAGASNFLAGTGVPPESYYPYTASTGSCSNAGSGWQGAADQIVSWQYVSSDKPDLTTLKNAVYTYGPIVTTMSIYADFYAYKSGVYRHVTGAYDGAHAVLIVGYVDDTAYAGGGYFIAKNSWGTGWGEPGGSDSGGYFRIAYSELKSVVKFGYYSIAYDNKATCSYSLDSSGVTVASTGTGSGVDVATGSTCPWTASSNVSWITFTNNGSGTGSGAVPMTVAGNTGTAARSGVVTVKDAIGRSVGSFTVTEPGVTYSLSDSSASFTSTGGTGSTDLTVGSSNATWSAASSATWLVITSAKTGSGSATISYSAAANTTSAARSATITVKNSGGKVAGTLTVSEAATVYNATSSDGTFTSAGGNGSISVSVDRSSATWSAVSSAASWLTVKSGATGTGNGTVSFSVSPATTTASRSGTVTVKDSSGKAIFTLKVSQAGASLSATGTDGGFTNAGGNGSISVSVDSSAATWTATSSASSWLVIKSGAKGTGSGTVGFTVAPNTAASTRTGSITVKDSTGKAFYTVNVIQDAASFGFAGSVGSFSKAGGTGSISVSVDRTDAKWSAASSASWLAIKSGSSGTGNGAVGYSAAANTGTSARTGTITIKDAAGKVILTKSITVAGS